MKINSVNYNVPNKLAKQNHKQQSFNGLGYIDKGALGVANLIENGGLAVSFTLQDMLGTNLPRPIMGLMRNKKENKGEVNKSFAAKELVREMTTGPSMFIMPGVLLSGAKKLFGKTVEVPANVIKSLADIHAKDAVNAAQEAIGKQDFYQSAFARLIQNAKSEAQASPETLSKAKEFAKTLADSAADKVKSKEAVNNIASEFVDISKKFSANPATADFTSAAFSDGVSANIKDAVSYIKSYADDIVEKAKGQDASKLSAYIKKLADKKVIGRVAMNVAMYSAVMAFLQIIPKLYNRAEGNTNAGLKGLMKEETLKDTAKEEVKEDVKKTDALQDKSKPSFGSASQVANALTGNSAAGKIARGIEFSSYNMPFPLLVALMGFGILVPRIKNAKDKYDREEILRRDLVTCAVMCAGEKELGKAFSKANEKLSGFVLASKDAGFKDKSLLKRLFDYIRPIKGVKVMSTDQIVAKYSNIGAYKDGLKGFCDFIDGQGGNLAKVLGFTDDSKPLIESILQKAGSSLDKADNKIIKDAVEKAKDSDEVKKLVELFKDKNNPWVKKARTLNARFTALSVLVLVPVFLGFMLPWINEKATKKKFAQDNARNNASEIKNTLSFVDYKTPELFKDMANFTK